MISQGMAIRHVVEVLQENQWAVAFFSMPNTAHTGVVPIPTVTPGARQRYPDVVATKDDVLLLAEIEPRLTPAVRREITRRFTHHDEALSDTPTWRRWSSRVFTATGVRLPEDFLPRHQLVVCQSVDPELAENMQIISAEHYAPPFL